MEHNFPFGYSGWEFWTTSQMFDLFWKFSVSGKAQQLNTIYSPTEIPEFLINGNAWGRVRWGGGAKVFFSAMFWCCHSEKYTGIHVEK